MITTLLIGERAVVEGVFVERESLLGYRVGERSGLSQEEALKVFGGVGLPESARGQKQDVAVTTDDIACANPSAVPEHQAPTGTGAADGERVQEQLAPGPEAEARISELKLRHGRAVRVTGRAKSKRAMWTGVRAWLVVSYPKEIR